jgi:hypothetical protein
MKRRAFVSTLATFAATLLLSTVGLLAQRRRVVVRRPPVRRTAIVVRPGHPIRRVMPRTVIVRPARTAVVVTGPLAFLPLVVWKPAVVAVPSRDRLVWEESEALAKDDDWVDCNFGVDRRGGALLLDIDGTAQLNMAEVTFDGGKVQVVDFEEHEHKTGVYGLIDFADGRIVKTVRVLAKAKSNEVTLTVLLRS